MSALALYASVADNPTFWQPRRDASTQTEPTVCDGEVQTDPCGFQTLGYAVVRRCPNPELVWDFVDATRETLHCGVLMLTRDTKTCPLQPLDT